MMTTAEIIDHCKGCVCLDWRQLFDFTPKGTFFQPLPKPFGLRQRVSDAEFLQIGQAVGWARKGHEIQP